ncbi:MAG: HAD-IA family hydrolase [Bauldia sp.]
MHSPPTLVLDLDGTLVDSAADLVATLNLILAGEGVAPLPYGEAVKKIGNGAKAMIAAGLGARGVSVEAPRLDVLYAAFIEHYAAHMADQTRPYSGAVEALQQFADAGWRLAICTNKLEGLSRKLLSQLGLADRFAAIAGQDTYGVRKPDPRHLTETIRAAGGLPERSVMVGDTSIDIDAARAGGVRSVAVSFGYSPVPVTSLGADHVIDHFDQLFVTVGSL